MRAFRDALRRVLESVLLRTRFVYWCKGYALAELLRRTSDHDTMLQLLETRRFRRGVRPTLIDVPDARRLLVLAPHQDDAIIGAGGLLLRCAARGCALQCLYITDGGHARPGITRSEMARIRREEAQAVWECVGSLPPRFLDLPCNTIEITEANTERLVSEVASFEPDALFLPFFLDDPDDHRRTNRLLLGALGGTRPSLEIWGYQVTSMLCPNVAVDITDLIDEKRRLMRLWDSQNAVFDYTHYVTGLNAANSLYTKRTGSRSDTPRYFELFFVTPWAEYSSLLSHYFDAPSP